jgi:phosphatidylglycerol:prolipoprotein diacylglycerol transferase
MLPFFEQPALHLGPLTIHAFGAAVAVALWVAFAIVERRFARAGLDLQVGHKLCGWMIAGGIIGAHLFSQLLYFPHRLADDPWVLLRVWDNISSFGGILGGFAGALLYFAARAPESARAQRPAYLDGVAFSMPIGIGIGRIGCALAHDHPGTVTSFPLAFSLETDAAMALIRGAYAAGGRALPSAAPTMGFHDLGLYEFLYLAFVVTPLFLYWNRRSRPTGFYLFAFAALYLPVRFGLEFLRVADVRYVGLTPAQWVAALLLVALPFAVALHRRTRIAVSGAVAIAVGLACSSGASRESPVELRELEALIPQLMREAAVPGVSVAVVRDAKVVWHREYGVRDAASGAPVDSNSVFAAASVSKTVFAYAVMQLVDRGVLALDTPLTSYTTDRILDGDPRLDLVTARHVLTHSSGLPNFRSGAEPLRIHFAPGEKYQYSGEGFWYLQSVLTRLAGAVDAQPCAEFEAGSVSAPPTSTPI